MDASQNTLGTVLLGTRVGYPKHVIGCEWQNSFEVKLRTAIILMSIHGSDRRIRVSSETAFYLM